MPFNFTKNFDFVPEFSIDGRPLDVEYTTKLLGVVIQSDCKWGGNTRYIVGKARKRMWYLRRLKLLGAPIEWLIDAYRKNIRSVLEMAVPLWTGGLTQKNKQDIESVQINCLKIITGSNLPSYSETIEKLGLDTLAARRDKLCLKFAKKCCKNPRFSE